MFARVEQGVAPLIAVMLVQIPLQFAYMNYVYLFMYKEDVRQFNTLVMIRALVSSVAVIPFLIVWHLGLWAVVGASMISVGASVAYAIAKFDGGGRHEGPLLNIPLIKDLTSYGSRLYAAGFFNHVNVYVTQFIVVLRLAPPEVAYFTMAQSQAQLLNKVPDALGTVIFPRIAKLADPLTAAALAARAFRVVVVILAAGGLVAAVLIAPAVRILYGPAFMAAIPPFLIILPGVILMAAASTLSQYFQGVGRADVLTKSALIPLVVQVATSPLLVRIMGLAGASLGLSIALALTAMFEMVVFIRVSSLAWESLVSGKPDIKIVLSFCKSLLRIRTDVADIPPPSLAVPRPDIKSQL